MRHWNYDQIVELSSANFQSGQPIRAVVWSVDLRWRIFEEAQGGVGFGAVVVEAGV
jgi:hypothetical protein